MLRRPPESQRAGQAGQMRDTGGAARLPAQPWSKSPLTLPPGGGFLSRRGCWKMGLWTDQQKIVCRLHSRGTPWAGKELEWVRCGLWQPTAAQKVEESRTCDPKIRHFSVRIILSWK